VKKYGQKPGNPNCKTNVQQESEKTELLDRESLMVLEDAEPASQSQGIDYVRACGDATHERENTDRNEDQCSHDHKGDRVVALILHGVVVVHLLDRQSYRRTE
jgi:hypothetical protein